MSTTNKEEKESDLPAIPYSINIMPVENVSEIPERIDVMGLLYNNSTQIQGSNCLIQQYLPKTLKKEITEDQIDALYDHLKLIHSEKKKNKNVLPLIYNPIMPFDKSSINAMDLQSQGYKHINDLP